MPTFQVYRVEPAERGVRVIGTVLEGQIVIGMSITAVARSHTGPEALLSMEHQISGIVTYDQPIDELPMGMTGLLEVEGPVDHRIKPDAVVRFGSVAQSS